MADDTSEHRYPCEKCHHAFSERHKLLLHKWLIHFDPATESMYRCYKCATDFHNPESLHSHSCFNLPTEGVPIPIVCYDGNTDEEMECGGRESFEDSTEFEGDSEDQLSESSDSKNNLKVEWGLNENSMEDHSPTAGMSICNEMLATCSSTLVHHEQKQEVKGEGLRDDPEDEFEPRCKVCNKPLVNNPRSVCNHVKAAHPHIGFKSMEQVVQRRLPCHRCGRRFILKCHLATHVRGCRYAEGKSSKNKIMFSDEFHAQPLSAPDRVTGTQENNKKKFKTSSVKSTTSTDRRHTARRKKGRKQWRRNKFPLLYTCKVCRQPFAYRGSFESHMRSRHPEEGKVADISPKKEEKERSVGQDSKRKSTISNTKVGNISDRVKEAKRDLQVCVLRKMSLVALHKKMPRCSVCRKTLADVSALITHRREVHNIVHTRKKRKCSPFDEEKGDRCSGQKSKFECKEMLHSQESDHKSTQHPPTNYITTGKTEEQEAKPNDQKKPKLIFTGHVGKSITSSATDNRDHRSTGNSSQAVTSAKKTLKKKEILCCGHCNKSFCNRDSLGNHILIRHTNKQYKCTLCPFATAYPSNLQSHYKVRH